MTPKQKAEELFSKYSYLSKNHVPTLGIKVAKQCALIAVDEILNEYETKGTLADWVDYRIAYWREVKQEIEKL